MILDCIEIQPWPSSISHAHWVPGEALAVSKLPLSPCLTIWPASKFTLTEWPHFDPSRRWELVSCPAHYSNAGKYSVVHQLQILGIFLKWEEHPKWYHEAPCASHIHIPVNNVQSQCYIDLDMAKQMQSSADLLLMVVIVCMRYTIWSSEWKYLLN